MCIVSEVIAAHQYVWHNTFKKISLCRKVTCEGYIDLQKKKELGTKKEWGALKTITGLKI